MHSKEKQVEQLLVNAKQALNFLRIVIDDLLLQREKLKPEVFNKVIAYQQMYKKHKAVLTNIEKLISKSKLPIPERFLNSLANNLRNRISVIIEDSIELDRLR